MAVTSVAEERPQRLRRIRFLPRRFVFATLAVAVIVALAVIGVLAFDRIYAGRVLPGVSVAGVDASGLSADELTARLEALTLGPAAIDVSSAGERVLVPSPELGRRIDVAGAVAAAMAAGRVNGPFADVPERFGIWQTGRAIDLAVSVDRPALVAWVAARAEELRLEPINARILPAPGGWIASTARDGRLLDQAAAVGAIEAALLSDAGGTAKVELPMTAVLPEFDQLDGVLTIAAAERMITPLTVVFRDDASWTVPTALLRSGVRFEIVDDRPVPVFDPAVLTKSIQGMADDIARPANETLILKTRSGSTFGFVPGKNGRDIDIGATAARIGDYVEERAAGTIAATAPVSIVLSVLPPELSAEQAAAKTHEVTLVGAWTTKFVSSERNHFGNNIRIPAKLINGTVVKPGQVFDFWKVVGPVTFERGFGMGGIIEGGKTNPTGAIGGGICSASTTIFNAALRAGYEILERDQHAYYIPRYPLGLDATVSKYKGQIAQNMRFRNDTANALYIRGLSGPGFVRFEIYSLPNGRTVTFSSPAVSNIREAIDTTVKTTTLKRGKTERVEVPADGMDVVVIRTVRNAAGAVIHTDRFVSHYIRVNGILMVGV